MVENLSASSAGKSGLIVVAVDNKGTDIKPLLSNATNKVIDDTRKGDLKGLYDDAISKAVS